MSSWLYLVYALSLFGLALVYFRIARKYNIVDVPNHRTMHSGATIRGGGIIIFIGVLTISFFVHPPGIYFSMGLFIIGMTGLLDDLVDLSSKIRFPLQVISIIMILFDLNLIEHQYWLMLGLVLIATGVLNAYNFMDGINGITGGYSLVVLLSLWYVNAFIQPFVPNSFLIFTIITVVVYSYFNFRNNAICFAGDVGSLSCALIIVYLILKLIVESQQIAYVLFLTLYGMDTIFTIIQRLAMKENIFEAHRLHFFQVVVRKKNMSHLQMSFIYMGIQAIISIIIIKLIPYKTETQIIVSGLMLMILSVVYILIKAKMMRLKE